MLLICPAKNICLIVSESSRIPVCSLADIARTGKSVCSLICSTESTFSTSVLFRRTITCLPFTKSSIFLSLSSRLRVASATYIIRSASPAHFIAFSIPIFSTISSVSRIPAVSVRLRITPSRLMDSSSVSLVVPAISVTIALSSPASALSRLDLPALVLPNITVLIPSFKIRPLSEVFNKESSLSTHLSTSSANLSPYPSSA